jgi:hypothetical protein
MGTPLLLGLALGAASATPAVAHAGKWSIGVHFGVPVHRHHYWYDPYPCYAPYPVYVAPRPVYVTPAPVYVATAPVLVQPQSQPAPLETAPAPRPGPAYTAALDENRAEVDHCLRRLADPSEQVRIDAVTRLGRLKADQAIDPLAATLSGDRSPAVREAAARALGIIGSPRALPALQYAAQADADRDVRHSARFATEVVQSNR